MNYSKIIIAIIITIIITIILNISFSNYLIYAEHRRFVSTLDIIQNIINSEITEKGYTTTTCGIDLQGHYFITEPEETMDGDDWIGLKEDTTDCYLSVKDGFNRNIEPDELRIIIENDGDSAGIKLIWKDLNQNLIPDIDERLGNNFKEDIEAYLKNTFQNAL